jgi:hypothetical protein
MEPSQPVVATRTTGDSAVDDFLEQIRRGVSDMVRLTITTTVESDDGSQAITTKIDLLDGDISTTMDAEFVDGRYVGLREFHAAREEQGHAIIAANVRALRSLARLAIDLIPDRPDLSEGGNEGG